jgi:hypothetical protein
MTEDLFTCAGIFTQPTPRSTYDGISARDDFLRREMEYGSQMLLRAMIRELEAMGRLA